MDGSSQVPDSFEQYALGEADASVSFNKTKLSLKNILKNRRVGALWSLKEKTFYKNPIFGL